MAPPRKPASGAATGANATQLAAALDWPCLRAEGDAACVLDLSVQPNAKRTEADGLHDGALRLRLAAPPVDGKANAALTAWLADALDCPKRDVTLLRGDSGRRKQLRVELPATVVAQWLAQALAEDGPGSAPGRKG